MSGFGTPLVLAFSATFSLIVGPLSFGRDGIGGGCFGWERPGGPWPDFGLETRRSNSLAFLERDVVFFFLLERRLSNPGGGGTTPFGLCFVAFITCSFGGKYISRLERISMLITLIAEPRSKKACSAVTESGERKTDGAKTVARFVDVILLMEENWVTSRKNCIKRLRHSRFGL